MKLENGTVHLWLANLSDFRQPQILDQCVKLLDESELKRADRFHFEQHRQRLWITRGILRSLLSRYADAFPPQNWRFCFNSHGRPEISASQLNPPVYFNLSHSGQHLALAISLWPLIGVDVEQVKARPRLLHIAERYFSIAEHQELCALPADRQLDRFYSLWTLKESYIKACGLGLAIPLRQFSFGFPSSGKLAVEFARERNDVAGKWKFWLHELADAKLALALQTPVPMVAVPVQTMRLRDLHNFEIVQWAPVAQQ